MKIEANGIQKTEAGVPTPVSEILDIVRGIDAGTREPAPATIDETLRRAGIRV